jgi:hypothetical protein
VVAKQTNLSKTNQVDSNTKIRKIRPIHRSETATVMRNNTQTGRKLGPANTSVNSGAAGTTRGKRPR